MSDTTTQVATVNPADIELLKQFGLAANVQQVEKINSISIKGSKFRYSIDGQVKTVEIDVDGEKMASPSVKMIVLNQIPARSYALFEGTYEEGSNAAPVCYSLEGKRPDVDQGAKPPEGATNCATCPKRIVGSAFSNGDESKPTRACKESKRLAVVLAQEPTHTPLKLQLPVTSLWEDKSSAAQKEANGWFSWDNFVKHLAAKGVAHTAMAEVTMRFDADASSPKLQFKFSGRLPDAAILKVLPLVNSAEVQKVLGLNREPRAAQTVVEPVAPVAPAAIAETVAPAPVVEKVVEVAKPKPAKKAAEPVVVAEASQAVSDQLEEPW
jgi:hypothetical protein